MKDDVDRETGVASPCVKLCLVHPEERICTGCFRTLDEIAGWTRMNDTEKQAVIDALPGRTGRLSRRRGGRSARLSRSSD